MWLPHAQRQSNLQDGNISDEDLDRILTVIMASYATGTRETYGSGLLVFHVFCNQRAISEPDQAPTSPALMLAYIAACAGSYSGKTLATYVCAVRAWHIIHGLPWAMIEDELKATLTGTANLAPPASRKPKCAPWMVALLSTIFAEMDPDNSLHVAEKCCRHDLFLRHALRQVPLEDTYLI